MNNNNNFHTNESFKILIIWISVILKDMQNIYNTANIISEIKYYNKKIRQPIP